LSYGILHELHNVLTHLNSICLIKNNLQIHSQAKHILSIFEEKKWRSTLSAYRKFVAFHFNEEIIKLGLDETKEEIIDLYKFTSIQPVNIYCEFADDIQFKGLMKQVFGTSSKKPFEDIFIEKSKEFFKYAS